MDAYVQDVLARVVPHTPATATAAAADFLHERLGAFLVDGALFGVSRETLDMPTVYDRGQLRCYRFRLPHDADPWELQVRADILARRLSQPQ